MFWFLPHGEAIPVHAVTQLASNGTRILAYLGHVDWPVVRRFALGLVPGAVLGTLLLWQVGQAERSEPYLKMLVGLYVLAAPFVPKGKGAAVRTDRGWDWPLLGLVAGTMALTVGAVGPLIAPLFARRAFVKEHLIATKATCQMLSHCIKLPAFALLGTFALGELGGLALPLVLIVIPGTIIGSRLMRYVSPRAFTLMYQVALVVAGAKVLILDGIVPIVRAGAG
jgi:uncharacterized membrane protein YfcA